MLGLIFRIEFHRLRALIVPQFAQVAGTYFKKLAAVIEILKGVVKCW
jgi:hypothetical protein